MVNSPLINLMQEAAREGGAILKKYFKTELTIDEKSNIHDIVTIADREAQALIINILKEGATKLNTSFGFIGEEGVDDVHGEYIFVIDPLDGTNNYSSQIQYFCVSIAVLKDSKPFAAAVYDVMKDEMYVAEVGKGAYKNGEALRFRSGVALKDSMVISTLSSRPAQRKLGLDFLGIVFPHVRTVRMFGAVVMDLVRMADGAGNVLINFSCNIWDIAAGILIFTEAGGEVVDWEGNPLALHIHDVKYKYSILGSDKENINKLIEIYKDLPLKIHTDTQK